MARDSLPAGPPGPPSIEAALIAPNALRAVHRPLTQVWNQAATVFVAKCVKGQERRFQRPLEPICHC
jgi:hypothetical protein